MWFIEWSIISLLNHVPNPRYHNLRFLCVHDVTIWAQIKMILLCHGVIKSINKKRVQDSKYDQKRQKYLYLYLKTLRWLSANPIVTLQFLHFDSKKTYILQTDLTYSNDKSINCSMAGWRNEAPQFWG